MKSQNTLKRTEFILHLIMCCAGGFLGGYAVMLRGCFGSAATGSMVSAVVDLASGDAFTFLLRLIGFFLFGLPFMLSRWIEARTRLDKKRFCLAAELLGLCLCALLPADLNPILGIYPTLVISALQWSAFSGTAEYACSTIFISNNTRQCFTALADYLLTKDGAKRARHAFYGASILCYLLTAFCAAALSLRFGPRASLFALPLPALAWLLLHLKEKQEKERG